MTVPRTEHLNLEYKNILTGPDLTRIPVRSDPDRADLWTILYYYSILAYECVDSGYIECVTKSVLTMVYVTAPARSAHSKVPGRTVATSHRGAKKYYKYVNYSCLY